jgi:hypothetical protein
MSYSSLKQLAHGLALLVLQRWSIWLLLVVAGVVVLQVAITVLVVVVRAVFAQVQDFLSRREQLIQ